MITANFLIAFEHIQRALLYLEHNVYILSMIYHHRVSIPYSGKIWRALNLAIIIFKFGEF